MEAQHNKIAYYPLMGQCKHTGEAMMEPMDYATIFKTDKKNQGTAQTRPKFHAMLLEELAKNGLAVEFDKEVVDYYEDVTTKKGGVILKDGSRHEADLVVAADGLRGKSWELVAGQPVPAKSSGQAIFRTAYPVELAVKDPMIAERFKLREDGRSVFELWMG
jgi:2-polyprenyl-6-methoxyphenol hydroxylase-like FAD-dependent oxidoreductase